MLRIWVFSGAPKNKARKNILEKYCIETFECQVKRSRTFVLRLWSPWSYKVPAARCSGNTSLPGWTNHIYLLFECDKNNSFLNNCYFPSPCDSSLVACLSQSFFQRRLVLSLCARRLRSGDWQSVVLSEVDATNKETCWLSCLCPRFWYRLFFLWTKWS